MKQLLNLEAQAERAAIERKPIQRNVVDVAVREHRTDKVVSGQRAHTDLVFTISLKRGTPNLLAIQKNYPIFGPCVDGSGRD